MEIAVSHPQPLFGAPLQHPLLQGAVIYPGKSSAWQPVVTSLPTMTEVPKESIIANTDFTTTSGLAKRRLSSKKRKKLEANRLSGGSDTTLSDGGSARSPSDSAYGSCYSVSSMTCTPPGHDRTSDSGHPQIRSTTASTLSHPSPLTHSSSSSFHPLVVHHPQTQSQLPPTSLTSETSALRNPGNCPPNTTMPTLVHNQFSNPAVLSQLQQELNYRFLSSGGHPHPSTEHSTSQEVSSRRPAGIKWCNAHISVAKMIQQHQLEEAQLQQQAQSQQLGQSVTQPHDSTMTHSTHTLSHDSQTEAAALSAQQQQLALLQMYGVHPTMSTSVQPGYMAVPYSTMHEVPLVHFAAVPQVNVSNNIAMVKPGEAVLSLPSGHPVQIAASGPGQMQQFAHAQNVPLTVNSSGGLLMQGGGSWMAPVPMVGGSCVINPLQAGILAAPWVK